MRSKIAALALMMASGFAGLGYQIVWTQQCALWLGHEAAAVLAVIAAFFGGLALGAFVLGPRIEASRRPLLWYVACELVIAAWSAVLAFTLSPVSTGMLRLIGAPSTAVWQWTVSFGGTLLMLLPATAAMGATLPALERVLASPQNETRSLAALYASNTFGAVLGVLASAFWLVPQLGLVRTASICIALNVICATGALLAFAKMPQATPTPCAPSSSRSILVRLAITGLLGIGYEVLVVRVLSEVTEDTVYTFALLLAVYLAGTALGAAGYERWLKRSTNTTRVSNFLLSALATACLLGTASLWTAETVKAMWRQLGAGMTAAVCAEAALALAAFALPTVVMGALFSHLSASAKTAGVSFGRALAVNTSGAAIAPLLFGVVALPLLGAKSTLLLLCCAYLLLISRSRWLNPLTWAPASVAILLAVWTPRLAFIDVPEGAHVVSYREGAMAAVSVVEDANGVAVLRINNRQQEGSSATLRVDGRQAWLPLLLHAAPKHALFLGLGTGVTAAAAARDPGLDVDAVELLPEVIAASAHFIDATAHEEPYAHLHLLSADARRYVRASEKRYDVIVADNFHPARSGSGALYTVEHFAAVRERLEENGMFCQWLPLHQLDLETLRSIVQSFLVVYPNGWAMLANNSLETPVLGLVGSRFAHFDVSALRARLAQLTPRTTLPEFGIEDEFALLGSFVAGPEALRHFAGNAELNTDDYPVVMYRAPRITYAPDSAPSERLLALLQDFRIAPAELVQTPDEVWSYRLAAYWAARNRFIVSGRSVRPTANVQEMLAQVREPLLSALRTSPDFRPAYDPLLRMATSLARTDVLGARALLADMIQAQPTRPEAQSMLERLATRE